MEALAEYWRSLGPIAPCTLLLFAGLLAIVGTICNWKWLYPEQDHARYHKRPLRKFYVMFFGVSLVAASILFYVFVDRMHW